MTASEQTEPNDPILLVFLTINYHCSSLLDDLIATTLTPDDPNRCMIVVDNSPNDPDLDHLADRSGVTLLRAKSNLGFGGGCNLGLDHAARSYPDAIIWLLNPDARLLPGAADTLRRAMVEQENCAVLGTRIRDGNGMIWFDGGRFDANRGRLLHKPDGTTANSNDRRAIIEPCDWLSGCSMAFNLRRLPTTPHFDPQIFLDYEDAELCLRLRQSGHRSWVTRDVLVEHAVSAVTGRAPRAKYRHATFSKLYLLDRHATIMALLLNLAYFTLKPIILLGKDSSQAQGRWAGLADYLRWRTRFSLGNRRCIHPRTQFTIQS